MYPNGLDTTYWWQYGTTTGYGAADRPGRRRRRARRRPASAGLSGLAPGTTYHYRLVAQNADGTTYGYDSRDPPARRRRAGQHAPAVSGTAAQGQTLSADNRPVVPAPTAYAYQWQRSRDGGRRWADDPARPAHPTRPQRATSAPTFA